MGRILAVAPGNSRTKVGEAGREYQAFPSVLFPLRRGYPVPNLEGKSRAIAFHTTPYDFLDGTTVIIGEAAYELSGTGRGLQAAAQIGKLSPSSIVPQILAGIEPLTSPRYEDKISLMVTVPRPELEGNVVKDALIGGFSYTFFDSTRKVECAIEIQSVEVFAECEPVATYMTGKNGYGAFKRTLKPGLNACFVDIGGGTVIVKSVSHTGYLLPDFCKIYEGVGVNFLAERIASDPRLEERCENVSVPPYLVIQALARGASTIYGDEQDGISFQDILDDYSEEWQEQIDSAWKGLWRSAPQSLRHIIPIGGGAHLYSQPVDKHGEPLRIYAPFQELTGIDPQLADLFALISMNSSPATVSFDDYKRATKRG